MRPLVEFCCLLALLAPQDSKPAGQLAGRVVRADGKPAPGARIEVSCPAFPELPAAVAMALGGRFSQRTAHRANERGEYRIAIDPLAVGHVRASDETGAVAHATGLRAGDARTLVLGRRSAEGPPEPARAIGGQLLDGKSGKPLAGIRVAAQDGAETMSDAEGRFTVMTPLAHVTVLGPRHELVQVRRLPLDPCPRLELHAGGALRARLLTADRRPLAQASVLVHARLPETKEAVALEVRTDAEGRFDVACLPADAPADAFVHTADGYAWIWSSLCSSDQDLGEVVVRTDQACSGRVEDATGTPLAGARLLLRPTLDAVTETRWEHLARVPLAVRETVADRGGRATFAGLAPGSYELAVLGEQSWPEFRRVTLPLAEPFVWRLAAGTVLRMRVVDAADNPLEGVTITLDCENLTGETLRAFARMGHDDLPTLTTGRDGRLAFGGVPPGLEFSVMAALGDLLAHTRITTGVDAEEVVIVLH